MCLGTKGSPAYDHFGETSSGYRRPGRVQNDSTGATPRIEQKIAKNAKGFIS